MSLTLICYDGSPSAQHALAVADRSLSRDPKVLLTVWSAPERVHADSFGYESPAGGPSYARLCELFEQAARDSGTRGQRLAAERGLDVEVRVERNRSTVWQTILEIADELDVEMIVAGTHGTTAVSSELLGSVSAPLAQHSRRPLLLVPTPDRVDGVAGSETAAARAST